MQSLLRPQALQFRATARHGMPGLWQPPSLSLLVLSSLLLLLALLLFATQARFKTTVRVAGVLVSQQGMVQLSSLSGGVVTALYVTEGTAVEAGQVIAEVSREQFTSEGLGSRWLDERRHDQRLAELEQELQLNEQRLQGESQRLQILVDNLQRELEGLVSEAQLLQQRLHLAATTQATQRALLERGLIAESDYQQQRNAVLSLQQQGLQLDLQSSQRRRQQQDAQMQMALLAVELEQRRSEYRAQRAEWQHSRQSQLRESVSTVVAPVSGRIAALSVGRGDVLRSTQVMAHLLPADYQLEALLFLPTGAAGRVNAGQSVIMQYEAFPLQTHGVHEGEVISFSASAIDPRQHHIPQLSLQQPVYLLRASLPAQTIADAADRGRLRSLLPGMVVQADIVTAEMTILAYLLEPITRLLHK